MWRTIKNRERNYIPRRRLIGHARTASEYSNKSNSGRPSKVADLDSQGYSSRMKDETRYNFSCTSQPRKIKGIGNRDGAPAGHP
jgi:hypothetical protein